MAESIHIGDGVYLSFDGYHVRIAVNDHRNHVVSLEPGLAEKIFKFDREARKPKDTIIEVKRRKWDPGWKTKLLNAHGVFWSVHESLNNRRRCVSIKTGHEHWFGPSIFRGQITAAELNAK